MSADSGESAAKAQQSSSRSYRYRVDVLSFDVTPLAAVEAYLGDEALRVLDISFGGAGLIFNRELSDKVGDILSLSISIRDHAFPVQVEVRAINGLKIHCAFVDPSKTFQMALKEFLKPKFLGQSLKRNQALSLHPDVLAMVAGAQNYEAFVGPSETATFLWTNGQRELLRLVAVTGSFIMEWNAKSELGPLIRTGQRRMTSGSSETEEPDWHRSPDAALLHHFADIFLAWLKFDGAARFVEKATDKDRVAEGDSPLVFPII